MQTSDFFDLLARYNTGRKKVHKLAKGLTERELNAWTKKHPEFALPADYVSLLQTANGFTLHGHDDGFRIRLLPLRETKWAPRHWFEDDTSEDAGYPATHLIVAADDNGDWAVALDTATGQYLVVSPMAEDPEDELPDLPAFLDWIVNQKLDEAPADAAPDAASAKATAKKSAKKSAKNTKSMPVPLREVARFTGHQSPPLACDVSPDGKLACSGGMGRSYDPAIQALGDPLYLWDIETGQPVRPFKNVRNTWYQSVRFSPDGQTVLAAGIATLQQFDVATGQQIRRFKCDLSGYETMSGTMPGAHPEPGDEEIVWAGFGGEMTLAESYIGVGESVCWLPDGQRALTSSRDRLVRLWDVTTGKELRTYPGHKEFYFRIAVSADGRRFASIGGDRTLRVRDIDSGDDIGRFEGFKYQPYCLAFSPDGKLLATGSREKNAVQIWDVETQQKHCTLAIGRTEAFAVAFSPDGTRLLCGTQELCVQLWDWQAQQEIGRFSGHHREDGFNSGVVDLAFAPGRPLAISAAKDNVVRVFEIPSRE